MPDPSARAIFAARLIQARQLRGLSQRALGDRMGLGKEKGSSRINRYEHQVTAIGFDNLEKLARVLDVPVAYLLADNPAMADAILEISKVGHRQQANLALAMKGLSSAPALTKSLISILHLTNTEQERVIDALASMISQPR